LTASTIISPPHQPNSASLTAATPTTESATPSSPIRTSFIIDCFVFDDYNKKVNQMNQLVTENKFIEGIKQSILYGNREFLRSFQLRLEIRERNISNGSNQDKNTVDTTTVTCLAPPFQNIGFLETKWLEIIKELVEHGNKNILKM
jgi:hypothetical protein